MTKTFLTMLLSCSCRTTILILVAASSFTRAGFHQAGTISVNTATSNGACMQTLAPIKGQEKGSNETLTAAASCDEREYYNEEEELDGEVIAEAVYEATSPAVLAVEEDQDQYGADIGIKQTIDALQGDKVRRRIQEARQYVANIVNVDPSYEQVRSICTNQHESCAYWAVIGECDANPAYMKINCAPVCGTCDLLNIEKRCPMDPNAKDALYPGDLDKLFNRILTDPEFQQYEPHAVSRPTLADGDDAAEGNVDYLVGGPWMVVFEKALNEEEATRLRELGALMGYERSKDVGHKKADGTFTAQANSGRTSTNSWCTDACYQDPIAQRVMKRIENITGISETNSENLQLLRYEQTQFYQTHSDYIPFQRDRQTGVRILTFYMYLNDVEEGGGTNFPRLNLTVTPKLGRAVLWPSVLNSNPNVKDIRSDHQALPVIRGVKFGANAWIHQRDYKGPNSIGC